MPIQKVRDTRILALSLSLSLVIILRGNCYCFDHLTIFLPKYLILMRILVY